MRGFYQARIDTTDFGLLEIAQLFGLTPRAQKKGSVLLNVDTIFSVPNRKLAFLFADWGAYTKLVFALAL